MFALGGAMACPGVTPKQAAACAVEAADEVLRLMAPAEPQWDEPPQRDSRIRFDEDTP